MKRSKLIDHSVLGNGKPPFPGEPANAFAETADSQADDQSPTVTAQTAIRLKFRKTGKQHRPRGKKPRAAGGEPRRRIA